MNIIFINSILLSILNILLIIINYIFSSKEELFFNSILIISYIMIPFSTIFSFLILYLKYLKRSSCTILSNFTLSFLPIMYSTIISLLIIYLFLNYLYIDTSKELKLSLIKNLFEKSKVEIIKIYGLKIYEQKISFILNNNIFSIIPFIYNLIIFNIYYFLVTIFNSYYFYK